MFHDTPSLGVGTACVQSLASAASAMLAAVDGAGTGARKVAAALGKPVSDWMLTVYADQANCAPGRC